MKDLIKNRLEVKTTESDAKSILKSLPMLIKKFDVDKFNIKYMSNTEAIFTFTTKVKPPREMIRTISRDHKDILFLLEYEGHGITKSMYLVKNDEVLNMEKKKKKRKILSDKELLKQIKKELDCNEIMNKFKVQKPTLQKLVKNLMVREKRFLEVRGLFPAPDEVDFKGRGIMIRKRKLEDSKFSSGDVFKITYNDDEIILSHIKRN